MRIAIAIILIMGGAAYAQEDEPTATYTPSPTPTLHSTPESPEDIPTLTPTPSWTPTLERGQRDLPDWTPTPESDAYTPTPSATATLIEAIGGATIPYNPTDVLQTVTPFPTPTFMPQNTPLPGMNIEMGEFFEACYVDGRDNIGDWTIQTWNSYIAPFWQIFSPLLTIIMVMIIIRDLIRRLKRGAERG
jgi:hypothetical protein